MMDFAHLINKTSYLFPLSPSLPPSSLPPSSPPSHAAVIPTKAPNPAATLCAGVAVAASC